MKLAQVLGLSLTLLALGYYLSFAFALNDSHDGSPSLGMGAAIVFSMLVASAAMLISSCVGLIRREARVREGVTGRLWHVVFAINSALAMIYSVMAIYIVIKLVAVDY
ncbi:hypothetical protein EXU30_07575 [Shewanella maritima]|uniref:Uncharacterized protein n=1 Tax=Shewanella maritima TaxID=2520507 RepID=A0A411PGQ9_9GAMM|nr:hypothetical protein [Shewanella maritima]QBF82570.1 hypothetical protein EXU30_07575 [Shewanella maritima]